VEAAVTNSFHVIVHVPSKNYVFYDRRAMVVTLSQLPTLFPSWKDANGFLGDEETVYAHPLGPLPRHEFAVIPVALVSLTPAAFPLIP